MGVKVRKRLGKFRLTEDGGRIVMSHPGKARDGGGFRTHKAAEQQRRAVKRRLRISGEKED